MDAILKSWDWYKDYCIRQHTMMSTKATCNKESIPYLYESIKFLHEQLELRQININFVFENLNLTNDDYAAIEEQFQMIIDYIFEHRNDLHVNMFDEQKLGRSLDDPENGFCGSGYMPTLGIDGKIYACFRYLPLSTDIKQRPLVIGDIENGFYDPNPDLKLIQTATRLNISKQQCINCPIETMCSWCPGGCYSEYGEFIRQTHICKIHQLQDKWSRVYWNRYEESKGSDKHYEQVANKK